MKISQFFEYKEEEEKEGTFFVEFVINEYGQLVKSTNLFQKQVIEFFQKSSTITPNPKLKCTQFLKNSPYFSSIRFRIPSA